MTLTLLIMVEHHPEKTAHLCPFLKNKMEMVRGGSRRCKENGKSQLYCTSHLMTTRIIEVMPLSMLCY